MRTNHPWVFVDSLSTRAKPFGEAFFGTEVTSNWLNNLSLQAGVCCDKKFKRDRQFSKRDRRFVLPLKSICRVRPELLESAPVWRAARAFTTCRLSAFWQPLNKSLHPEKRRPSRFIVDEPPVKSVAKLSSGRKSVDNALRSNGCRTVSPKTQPNPSNQNLIR